MRSSSASARAEFEFEFEGDVDNVSRAIKEMDVGHPLAVDNDDAVWRVVAATASPSSSPASTASDSVSRPSFSSIRAWRRRHDRAHPTWPVRCAVSTAVITSGCRASRSSRATPARPAGEGRIHAPSGRSADVRSIGADACEAEPSQSSGCRPALPPAQEIAAMCVSRCMCHAPTSLATSSSPPDARSRSFPMHKTPIRSSAAMRRPTFDGHHAHAGRTSTREIPVRTHAQGDL